MAYFKNGLFQKWPISKNGLFKKLAYSKNGLLQKWPISKMAYFKIFAGAIIIVKVTLFSKKTPQLLETHYNPKIFENFLTKSNIKILKKIF